MPFAVAACLIFLLFHTGQAQTPAPTPEPIREEVLVTANRVEAKLGDTPSSIYVLSRVELEASAAPTVDDVLRQTVGFSIFRRSSSRNANPTTQGVSLRGVGASGASRTGVYLDGVPINDPFGGWVQWNRVPPAMLERVEVIRGGASSLYGESALTGAINLVPRRPEETPVFAGDIFVGTQKSVSGSAFAGFAKNGWAIDGSAMSLQVAGYKPIDEAVRGPVDANAGVRASAFSATLRRELSRQASLFFRPSYFGEVRTNGTGLQTNRTHSRRLTVGGDYRMDRGGVRFDWRAYAGNQVYDQTFSVVAADRRSEALNRVQRVPAGDAGGSFQVGGVKGNHSLLFGADIRNVYGASDETAIANGVPTNATGSGGRQSNRAAFVQDIVSVGERTVIAVSLRYQAWTNSGAFAVTRSVATGAVVATQFPDREDTALVPQIGSLIRITDRISIFAGASRSFRSPTLNELYRGFRVGNVVTLPNADLTAETATNFEAGASFRTERRFTVRANVFTTGIDRTVANVTLSVTPSLITRQRQNAGATRSTGLETEAELRLGDFVLTGGYLFVDSSVRSFPSNPALEGLRIPQIPRHQVTFQGRYARGGWVASMQARGTSEQFDDDLNLFRLEPYSQMDVFVSRRVNSHFSVYAAVENLFNSRYSIARTPVRSVSAPIALRIGLRWN